MIILIDIDRYRYRYKYSQINKNTDQIDLINDPTRNLLDLEQHNSRSERQENIEQCERILYSR